MGLNLDRLVFDTANADDGANVGAYLRSSDGTLITHTTVGGIEALDVNIAQMSGQYAEDAAHGNGDLGNFILAVRSDADASLVDTDGDYAPLQVDENGRLKVVADIEVANGFEKLEDSAHSSGDVGAYILGVIQGTLSASAADGDYGSIKTDLLGRTYVTQAKQSGVYAAVSVADTATDIVGTDLANRTSIIIQNASNRDVFLGLDASVTTSNGIRLSAGSSMEVQAGASLNWHGITSSGTADVRYMELV